jgi:methyl-accepting chemotaxis protein
MSVFRSYRSKLQTAFVSLGLAAILLTGWIATSDATEALQQATYARLTAIRETKRQQIETYFRYLRSHVLALSIDESSISALEEFRDSWDSIPPMVSGSPGEQALRDYYEHAFAPTVKHDIDVNSLLATWYPADLRTRTIQHWFLSSNPHPIGSKDLLLAPSVPSRYGAAHRRYHPTLHRYQTSFGLYDIFLIDVQGRILYTVLKEIDLGVTVSQPPFAGTALANVFDRALRVQGTEDVVMEDYSPYIASHYRPAAFAASPIWRAGAMIGVLAVQVSIQDVNRVMTGGRNWAGEGLGQSGQAYIAGPDRKLRSDPRFELENPDEYLAQLRNAIVPAETVERIKRHGTVVLDLDAGVEVGQLLKSRSQGTHVGKNMRGEAVLRSYSPASLPGLDWFVVAEIDAGEAFAPVVRLRERMWTIGLLIAGFFFAAAWWMARSVTRPVQALAESARRLGSRDFAVRIPIESADEVGQLAASFNRMAEQLESTTVSKEELDRANQELRANEQLLKALAARLITAEEEERSRVARELHDDITQRVAALAIQAGQWKRGADVTTLRQSLERLQIQLGALSNEIHGLSRRLHSSTLGDLGLAEAIENECRSFFDRGGPPVDVDLDGDFSTLSPNIALTFYRIVQESLRNIEKHSAATEVKITMRSVNGKVELEIHDNGIGFDSTAPKVGLGLSNMKERARLVGGTLEVVSKTGKGTTITVSVPWREDHGEAPTSAC